MSLPPRAARWCYAGLVRLSRGASLLAVWVGIPALICLVLVDVCLRTFGFSTLSWGWKCWATCSWVFSSSSYRRWCAGEWIRMDLLLHWHRPGVHRLTNRVSRLCIALVSGMIAWQGFSSALEMHQYQEQAYTLALPLWPLSCLIGLSGVLMGLLALAEWFCPQEALRAECPEKGE